ncbi:MAG: aminoacyl--tRNA ligase-related protein [Candidatus Wolfebacteria bacterium]|nr:aminoacyl--tRNA ligase-related protein [Candidatus Wolfebacteria bacterium]MDP2703871.1 aminoacyl--tRNA ligase-related protein [bacterium]
MRQSELFTRTRKEAPKDEVSTNARLLVRAGFADKLMAGVYTLLPLGMRVYRKIENIIRREMDAIGGQELLMPSLQPKANWEKTGRWKTYDSLFRFMSYYTKGEYALGPTHEEVVVPLVQGQNLSYKDFPVSVYQIQTKFRDEARAKSGLLRGREFSMKDLYSFHTSEKDLDAYYEKAKMAYYKIFEKVGLGDVTYLTFASGGSFSKYSHEFQTLSDAGEDIIYLCAKCKVAVNKEIIDEQKECPECGAKKLKEEKAIEVGNIFKLKTKYSSAFGLKFKDEKGKEGDVIMGCYGIGLTRLLGTIVEAHHDERGMIWPESVAPFAVHLVRLGQDAEVLKFADDVYATLRKKGAEVLYDDREASAGEKFADADLFGIPYRIVVSEKTVAKKKVEIKKREEKKEALMSIEEFMRVV